MWIETTSLPPLTLKNALQTNLLLENLGQLPILGKIIQYLYMKALQNCFLLLNIHSDALIYTGNQNIDSGGSVYEIKLP